jgi:hypothetical protein
VFFIRRGGNPAIFDSWGKIKGVSIRRILTSKVHGESAKKDPFWQSQRSLSSEALA